MELATAVIGSFAGAMFAFYFARYTAAKDQCDKQYSAIIKAQAAFLFHVTSLERMERTRISMIAHGQLQESPHRIIAIKDVATVDFQGIAFLAEDKAEQKGALRAAHFAELRYLSAIAALEDRNDLVAGTNLKSLQPGSPKLKQFSDDLIAANEALENQLTAAIEANVEVVTILKNAGEKLFPKRRFLDDSAHTAEPQNI